MDKEKEEEVSLLPNDPGAGYVEPRVKCLRCLRIVPVGVLEKTGWRCPHDDCKQMLKLVGTAE